ncbi:MAG: entericidin A/B family lipoprotein [Alphaproteobacteria bacterium]|nr:entericidin A/B family lipoprotein [Alphaproteobacteria bacterium]
MKKIAALLVLSVLSLSACNTVEGFGRDMQQGGKSLERSAQDSK